MAMLGLQLLGVNWGKAKVTPDVHHNLHVFPQDNTQARESGTFLDKVIDQGENQVVHFPQLPPSHCIIWAGWQHRKDRQKPMTDVSCSGDWPQ